jgi:putative transposase
MGRAKRTCPGGLVYHVLNRANGRLRIFRKEPDFAAFEQVLAEGLARIPIRLLGYCLMSNHWHLLLWPREDGQMSSFLQWITLTHTQRWHADRGTSGIGHLYQGRFKSFPVQSDSHYLTVLRYIESNPMRAGAAASARQWPWSSLAIRQGIAKEGLPLHAGPVPLPPNWMRLADLLPKESDVLKCQECIRRGRPYGSDLWTARIAARLDLYSTLRPRGRPRKESQNGT